MVLYLTGRRGSGKTTLATELARVGYLRIHAAAIAEEHELLKDDFGSYIGLAGPLREEIARSAGDIVVDGSPRTPDQAELVRFLAARIPSVVVLLDVSAATSSLRMRNRGNSEITIERADRRWEAVEHPTVQGLEHYRIDASQTPDAIFRDALQIATRCR